MLYCITACENNDIKQYRKILYVFIFTLYVIYYDNVKLEICHIPAVNDLLTTILNSAALRHTCHNLNI